jgi:hypothetical protein
VSHEQPSAEQRRLAYRQLARPGWPATLDAALQVQHYRIAIDAVARNMARRGLLWALPPTAFDARAAAANDRPESAV